MGEKVNLVIFPSVQEGEDVEDVKSRLTKTLRVDQNKVESWFKVEEPTTILQDVDEEVAERYVDAIMQCGAECNTHPTGKSGLSLVPKTANKNTRLWICPSCEYEEEIMRGEDTQSVARRLVDLTLERGATDNVTVCVVEFSAA